jgi:hypothetical protein
MRNSGVLLALTKMIKWEICPPIYKSGFEKKNHFKAALKVAKPKKKKKKKYIYIYKNVPGVGFEPTRTAISIRS